MSAVRWRRTGASRRRRGRSPARATRATARGAGGHLENRQLTGAWRHGIASIEVKGSSLWATRNAIPLGVAWLKGFIPLPTARLARPQMPNGMVQVLHEPRSRQIVSSSRAPTSGRLCTASARGRLAGGRGRRLPARRHTENVGLQPNSIDFAGIGPLFTMSGHHAARHSRRSSSPPWATGSGSHAREQRQC